MFAFDIKKFMEKEEPLLWRLNIRVRMWPARFYIKAVCISWMTVRKKFFPAWNRPPARSAGKVKLISPACIIPPDRGRDKLYLINEKGILSVVTADPAEFKLLSTIDLGQDLSILPSR